MKLLNSKLNNYRIYIAISLIIFPLLVLFIINLNTDTEKKIDYNDYSKLIENCNYKLSSAVNSKGLDLTEAKDCLSTQLINLNKVKDSLSQITPTEETDIAIQDKLLESLNYNISLYEESLTLLKDDDASDLLDACNNCSNNYTSLLDDYNKLCDLGLNTEMPDDSKNFFDLLFNYFNTYVKVIRENDIKLTQKQTYVSSIEECINSFNTISEDLKPALDKIHEENRDLTVLLQDVKEKKASFNEIKNKSYSITIPEEGNSCFELLKDTLTYYDLYITSLEQSIILDKTCNNENNCSNIEENYNNSFSKYNDFLTSLKDLSTELDKFNKN